MHADSMALMRAFLRRYYRPGMAVLDVGSMDVNGCYRALLPDDATYTGLDIAPGPNVHLVVTGYDWPEAMTGAFDLVISGQCFEHVPHPWLLMPCIAKAMRPGAIACIIAPSTGHEHRYPMDCYRYMPDGMRALAEWAGLTVVGIEKHEGRWGDVIMVATLPPAANPDGETGHPVTPAPDANRGGVSASPGGQ